MAFLTASGTVTAISRTEIVVKSPRLGERRYRLQQKGDELVTEEERHTGMLVFPRSMSWQEPVVKVGQQIKKKELVARGVTQIFFQANVWVFTFLSLIIGAVMGIGKAAVYRHIPDYFPNDVGVVGGIVGVLGGLGGFICPVIFGYLLRATGLWTTCWMFFIVLVAVLLIWMHIVVKRLMKKEVPELIRQMEPSQPGSKS